MIPSLPAPIASVVELTLSGIGTKRQKVAALCDTARQHMFRSVCVASSQIELARTFLEETDVQVTGLVGWPWGEQDADVKRFETEVAVDFGVQEIEAVVHLGRLREGNRAYVLREMRDIVEAADERHVKLVADLAVLAPEELSTFIELALDSGAKALSLRAGDKEFPTPEQVRKIREMLGPKFGLKSAAEPSAASCTALLEAGVTAIGLRFA